MCVCVLCVQAMNRPHGISPDSSDCQEEGHTLEGFIRLNLV